MIVRSVAVDLIGTTHGTDILNGDERAARSEFVFLRAVRANQSSSEIRMRNFLLILICVSAQALICRFVTAQRSAVPDRLPQTNARSILPVRLPPTRVAPAHAVMPVAYQESGTVVREALPPPTASGFSLEELEQIALQSNPSLVQSGMAVEAAQGDFVTAGLYPNPVLGPVADEIGNGGSAGLIGGFVLQRIVTAGKRQLGQAAASWAMQQALHGMQAQQLRILNDVRTGYYEVLWAQETVKLNEELLRIGNEGLDTAEKLLAAAEVSRADVLQARIEARRARLGLVQAKNQHDSAWRRLTAVLGRPEMELAPLEGELGRDLPSFEWDETLTQLLTASPRIAQAQSGVERARSQFALECAKRVPDFEVGAAVKYADGSRSTVADVQVGLPLPVFDRNQGNIVRARAGVIAAEEDVRRIELLLQQQLATVFANYINARREVDIFTDSILPDAQSALEMTRTGYREGEFSYLELLTAQRTFFNVSLNRLASLGELWMRSVQLEGLLLNGSLKPLN